MRGKIAPALRPLAVAIESLRPDPDNLRLHDQANLEVLKGLLDRFGQQKPVVIDHAGMVIAGNGVLQAAKLLGWTHLAASTTDLAGPESRHYAIADNRSGELSEWDRAALASTLGALDAATVSMLGFTAEDIAGLSDQVPELQDDPAPAPLPEAVTRRGDLWNLGKHRLLCGDSSKPGDLDRLLARQPIHLVNTDPPYNVKVEPRSNNAIAAGLSSFQASSSPGTDAAGRSRRSGAKKTLRAKDRPLENDFIDPKAFEGLLRAWFGNIARVLIPGGGFYVWGGYANTANYPPALAASGLYFSQSIIWDKQHPVLTRKDFMGAHEWCFYGWKEGAAHRFFGPANVPDLWQVKKVNPQSMVHLTEKPVELAARALAYSSLPGENVLDLFGGSGSTLMACQQMGRQGYLMELDPPYCDVIIRRWQDHTGEAAVLESTGLTWEQTAQERGVPTQAPAAA